MAFLQIKDLDAYYGKARALHDISLEIEEGGIVAVIGPNGAGKSTLLDSIMGFCSKRGKIFLDGDDITSARTAEIVKLGVGYAPERFNLFPYMTVRENLMVGAYTSRQGMRQELENVYKLFPRLGERENQETSTQSGGERQMVSLGRALMSSPRLLLIDEPTIGLAPKVCLEIAAAIRRMRSSFNLTVLITEQNANFAMSLAEHVYVLESGHIRAQGTAIELQEDSRLTEAYFGVH